MQETWTQIIKKCHNEEVH